MIPGNHRTTILKQWSRKGKGDLVVRAKASRELEDKLPQMLHAVLLQRQDKKMIISLIINSFHV